MHNSNRMIETAGLTVLGLVFIVVAFAFAPTNITEADAPPTPGFSNLPTTSESRGLVYDGLQAASDNLCQRGFRLAGTNICTHGPDPSPIGVDVTRNVPPDPPELNRSSTTGIVCDGDGVTGNRVQVVYVHGADVSSRLGSYLASIRAWAAGADSIYDSSANETGGSRHIRFVTDSACNITVLDARLSLIGKFNFNGMISALKGIGYVRTDRKYLLFVDTNLYCGIGNLWNDDQPGALNANNRGPSYARVDNGCWGATNGPELAAHELMHTLGAVQLSAPHSSGGWHCTDEYDRMCYSDPPNYPAMQYRCTNPAHDRLFDCKHDDYYNTNPPAGSYLATHWNAARNQFLIVGAAPAPPGPGVYQDRNAAVKYSGAWSVISNTLASGGTFHHSRLTGSEARLTFAASQVTFKYSAGPNEGKANVYIDNVLVSVVDQYSATKKFQLTKTYSGLGAGTHTIRVRASGTKNGASSSYWVVLDAFIVSP